MSHGWDPFADPADDPHVVASAAKKEAAKAVKAVLVSEPESRWYIGKPVVEGGRKLRIACLHGTSSNEKIMRMQVAPLSRYGKDVVELVFIQGSLRTEDIDPGNEFLESQKKAFPGQDFYQYAKLLRDDPDRFGVDYEGLDSAIEALQKLLQKEGPFDGVLGFSQGSNQVSMLAAQAVHKKGVPLAFVIQICCQYPAYAKRYPELFAEPLKIPALIVFAMADPLTTGNSGDRPTEIYANPVTLKHSGDHRPFPRDPAEAKALVEDMLSFMREAAASK